MADEGVQRLIALEGGRPAGVLCALDVVRLVGEGRLA
jgi:hypothetical protein